MTIHLSTPRTAPADPPEPRWCDGCQTFVPQTQTPDGEWPCGAGHNATAALERDFQLSADVGAAARQAAEPFLAMTPDERRKWWPLFIESIKSVVPDLPDAPGKEF